MFKVPAHKQIDPDKLPGQITSSPSSADVVLDDYIKRKQAAYGMEPKITFEEWWARWPDRNIFFKDTIQRVWNIAQENK